MTVPCYGRISMIGSCVKYSPRRCALHVLGSPQNKTWVAHRFPDILVSFIAPPRCPVLCFILLFPCSCGDCPYSPLFSANSLFILSASSTFDFAFTTIAPLATRLQYIVLFSILPVTHHDTFISASRLTSITPGNHLFLRAFPPCLAISLWSLHLPLISSPHLQFAMFLPDRSMLCFPRSSFLLPISLLTYVKWVSLPVWAGSSHRQITMSSYFHVSPSLSLVLPLLIPTFKPIRIKPPEAKGRRRA